MTDFTAFVVLKTINGALWPSIFQIPYIIVLELVSPEMRVHISGLINCFWSFGMCLLPLVAYLSRSWVTLGHVTSSLTVICFIYWKYLPESPRWLLSQERYDKALTIMKKIGDVNGKPPDPDQLLAQLKTLGDKIKRERMVDNVKNSSSDLLKYPKLRKAFIIVSICWSADILAYYGLQINVTNLAGNEFLNFFLTSIVKIPSYISCWLLMDKLGRRWVSVMWFLMTGLTCMLPAFVSELPYADIICSMIGKYCASAAFIATYQQSSELYPTVVRTLGMGMSSTVSMIASILVPYLVYLIGSSCIIAGIAASFLPETLNEPLPQTISDAEEFGKDQKYFSWNRRKRSISRDRAASVAIQMTGFENKGMNDDYIKDRTISPLFQNSGFLQNEKNSTISNQSEKKNNIVPDLEKKSTNKTSDNELQTDGHRVDDAHTAKGKIDEMHTGDASDTETLSGNNQTNKQVHLRTMC